MKPDHKEILDRLCATESCGVLSDYSVGRLPSVTKLREIVRLISELLFPEFFDEHMPSANIQRHVAAVRLENIFDELSTQIRRACRLTRNTSLDYATAAETFVSFLPSLRDILLTDVEAMFQNDPAATDRSEVIFCYPAFTGMLYYRIAHALLSAGVPLLPRIITETAHSLTGIDIHPGAQIGSYFSIDHGTGVVIGETCIIGHHVSIYQGVTLGAKNFVLDNNGHPLNVPRHPIISDHVTIYSNATILGRITIGHHAVIGGNVWVTHDVPAHARVVQRPPVEQLFTDGAGI